MSKFQIILLSIFGVAILGAVIVFSVFRGSSSQNASLTIWGPISQYDFATFSANTLLENKNLRVTYVEKSLDTFDRDFTEALAIGQGPDIVIIPENFLWAERQKLLLIPYQSVSQKDFVSTFAQEGELFLSTNGIYALPLYMDPMVLYSNRDLLSSAAIATPMKYWDEIFTYIPKLTKKDDAGNITKATIALGEANNIPHSKDVLSLLMLQAGTPITSMQGEELRSEISNSMNLPVIPAAAALDFYTQFSNQAKNFYTWNRSLLPAETSFVSGDSAFYLGFGSELKELRAKNPNLNLGISSVPQSRVSGKEITLGHVYGLAIVKASKSPNAALSAILTLISKDKATALTQLLSLPPARRDLLSLRPTDGFQGVLYDAAIQSKGWIDPDSMKTRLILNSMIESVTSGRARTEESVSKANEELNSLIK